MTQSVAHFACRRRGQAPEAIMANSQQQPPRRSWMWVFAAAAVLAVALGAAALALALTDDDAPAASVVTTTMSMTPDGDGTEPAEDDHHQDGNAPARVTTTYAVLGDFPAIIDPEICHDVSVLDRDAGIRPDHGGRASPRGHPRRLREPQRRDRPL